MDFLVCFSTATRKEKIEELLNKTIFLRELEFEEIEEYPEEIKALFSKKQIILEET